MVWRYEPRMDRCPTFNEPLWGMVEAYYDNGKKTGETVELMRPHGATLQELEEDLEHMLQDLRRYKHLRAKANSDRT